MSLSHPGQGEGKWICLTFLLLIQKASSVLVLKYTEINDGKKVIFSGLWQVKTSPIFSFSSQ